MPGEGDRAGAGDDCGAGAGGGGLGAIEGAKVKR